jgi:hypothetical protein
MQIDFKQDAGLGAQGSRDPEDMDARDSTAQSQAWDPYQVWLKRVRQPRDGNGSSRLSGGAGRQPRTRT